MTKEKLINWIELYSGMGNVSVNTVKKLLNEFFDSNVCIPKGDNRHLYADVLHEWVEGAETEFAFKGSTTWLIYEWSDSMQYRIKPSEAIYEYLWYNVDGDTKWMTLDEAKEFERPWFWAKETSRMRQ